MFYHTVLYSRICVCNNCYSICLAGICTGAPLVIDAVYNIYGADYSDYFISAASNRAGPHHRCTRTGTSYIDDVNDDATTVLILTLLTGTCTPC
jgi:hypothetical protein